MTARGWIVTCATVGAWIAVGAQDGSGRDDAQDEGALAAVEARLSPGFSRWRAGDTPRLALEILNHGDHALRIPRCPTLVELRVDGVTARFRGPSETPYLGVLAAGRRAPLLDLELDVMILDRSRVRERWNRSSWPAGRHTVEATVVVESLEDSERREVSTEAVELEIEPASRPAPAKLPADLELSLRRAITYRDVATPRLGLYLVRSNSARSIDGTTDVDSLDLEAAAVIDERDIVAYNWAEHEVELTSRTVERLPSPGVFGLYFVVVADGQRCYAGAFWTPLSSSLPKVPMAYPPKGALAALSRAGRPGVLAIDPSPIEDAADPRSDPRVREILQELGKLW